MAAACVTDASSELVVLLKGTATTCSTIRRMQQIKPASADPRSTLPQEHMLHQFTTSGTEGQHMFNKSQLPEGALTAVSVVFGGDAAVQQLAACGRRNQPTVNNREGCLNWLQDIATPWQLADHAELLGPAQGDQVEEEVAIPAPPLEVH